MEEPKKVRMGRPPTDKATHKKARALSFTDQEYEKLNRLATEAGESGPSSFLVNHHKLNEA